MHFYGWRQGLKTGVYYLRTQPAASAIQFTVEKVRVSVSIATCFWKTKSFLSLVPVGDVSVTRCRPRQVHPVLVRR